MRFDLTDLRIFLSALDSGSLTASAAENNVVVAAVSARIKRLEAAFGLELFERTGRGIRPTMAGDMFARRARVIVDDARRAEAELQEFADGRSGHVRLLSNTNMLAEHMPQALGAFLAAHPDIRVSVQDRPSLEVVSLLKTGEADMGIVAVPVDMTGLERVPFVSDRLVLAVPHGFAHDDGEIAFSRILDLNFIGLQDTAALTQFLRRIAKEIGRPLTFRMQMNSFEEVCRMVEAGAGVAVIPESAARRYPAFMAIRALAISDAWAERELYLCARNVQQLPGFAQVLFHHLVAYVAQRARDAEVFGGA
ncbi:LysR family transcriptional regulator [Azorhizobium oxalatiphilum]|uniref:LysR family transcriptional regulator n=1 Tax=Azorhizobium oxalatiphilum TaxID=980631 RepID=A0A917BUJ3_9HYPH|nr:LysR family transcriptional regulator [Azorhizobium oxalatiphilum]GGF57233.1 LysR family transcriptional regulator [Azorhizobium oxalatiphilum]